MRLNIEAFSLLATVVEEGSFARAAQRLHKTQSSISYQVKKLEEELGVTVFDRSEYRACLTPVGQAILLEGQRLLKMADHIQQLALRFQGGWEPKLEVVIDGALPVAPVMQALKIMADQSIPTRIQMKMEFLGGVQSRFESDRADMMIVVDYKPSPLLKAQPLKVCTFVLVAARQHPLAEQQTLTHSQLLDHVELTIQDSSGETIDALQFGGDRVFYLSDFSCKKDALLMGLGFGWMPESMIAHELNSGELSELDYRGGTRHQFTPHLVYSLDAPLGKAGEMFRGLVADNL
jgi:DNA-binding transcriptional LysR family regulator